MSDDAQRMNSLTGLFSDWYWVLDADLRYISISGHGDERYGTVASTLVGQKRFQGREFLALDMSNEAFEALHIRGESYRDVRARIRVTSGAYRYISISGEALRDDQGRVTGYHGVTRDTTREHETMEALRRSEDRFRSLTDLSSDWYWEQDAEMRFTGFSGGDAATKWGVEQSATIGLPRWELPGVTPVSATWEEHRAVLAARQPFRHFEYRRVHADGMQQYVSASGEPVFDAQGRFTGYRGVATDITQRKREEQLRMLEHQVARLLAAGDDPGSTLEAVIGEVCNSEAIDSGRYFAVDEQSARLKFSGGWAAADEMTRRFVDASRDLEFRSGEGLAGSVWQSGVPLWVEDVTQDPRVSNAGLARAGWVHSAFVVPVQSEGRTIGVVSFSSRRMRAPEERLLRTVHSIGSQIGQFLQRKLAERERRESEERFRSLTALSVDWYWEQGADLRYTRMEGRNFPLEDAGPPTWLGKLRWDAPGIDADDPVWAVHRRQVERHEAFINFEYSLRDKHGVHWVSVSGEPTFSASGAFTGYRGVGRDITHRVEQDQALRESHKRFEMVAQATNDVVWDWTVATGELWWNENYYSVFGFQREQTKRGIDSWTEFIHPQDRERVVASIFGVKDGGGTSWSDEYRFRRADGEYLHILDRCLVIHDAQGKAVRMIGAMLDITGRKRAERAAALHARRQQSIAAFGQFALQRRENDALAAEAVAVLGEQVDVAVLFALSAGDRIVLHAARGGEAPQGVGQSAPLLPGSAAQRVLESGQSVRLDAAYLGSTSRDWPWSGWMRQMCSGALVPVTHDGQAHGMLGMFSRSAGAIGDEEVGFAESVGHMLSTALQREQAEQRLAFLAQFDSLTGLPNRSLLEDRLRQTLAQSRRRQLLAGVLFVDLDRFKLINDTLGHESGDRVIREVARRLEKCVRGEDTVGRLSGDEFAVVLAELGSADAAALVAQKILDALTARFDLAGSEAFVSASIGISIYPADGEDADTLLRHADMAMYQAKKSTRNAYRYFTARMNDRTAAKLQLNTDLRHAVERREFALHYQPKVDLRSGALTGMEALLRWNHPQRGQVLPGGFIGVLEDSGLILPVGEWVIDEACAQIRRWLLAGLEPVPVSVNLSAKQFRRRDLDRMIERALSAAGLPATLLEIEITESSLADDPDDAVRILENLHAAGLGISVDDFGTGYSSLAYLMRLPLSALKIDRSFVRDAVDRPKAASIVRAVIDLAHNLQFTVVAEGVETEAQAQFLRIHRCDQAQGYLYGRPVAPAEIQDWLVGRPVETGFGSR